MAKHTLLSRARTVMDLITPRHGGAHDHAYFASRSDDDGSIQRSCSIPHQDWDDMGRPTRVTVTIEPGDLLND